MPNVKTERIVIIGGGAAGLELATALGDQYGASGQALITLIDKRSTHIWKPLLHEIAAATLAVADCEVSYIQHAFNHHFRYEFGEAIEIDREARAVRLAALSDSDGIIGPSRVLPYDRLILAVGSLTNTFNTPGVEQHAFMLNDPDEAERFREALLKKVWRVQAETHEKISVVIVGAGATGVELAAELHDMATEMNRYGTRYGPDLLNTTVIDAGSRILPATPQRVSDRASDILACRSVRIVTGQRVVTVEENSVRLHDTTSIPADLVVWASGIRAPGFLSRLGLKTSRFGQVEVDANLRSISDPRIFAMGDCSSHTPPEAAHPLGATAQVAHQQAMYLAKNFASLVAGKKVKTFTFHDKGSLVSLGNATAVGALSFTSKSNSELFVVGSGAKALHICIYWLHQRAVHGTLNAIRMFIVDRLRKIRRFGVKAY